jgi:penicillin G amidase
MAFNVRHDKSAIAKAIAVVVVAALILIIAFVAWMVRSPLPKLNGTLLVAGISSPVTIRRDTRGIPHIEGSSEDDLFFGEGFACAQGRLWQMDLLRRTAEGKLSEVVGPATLSVDQYMRTIGLGVAAQHDAANLSGQSLRDAEAYAAGVNAAAASRQLPLEFRLLGYKPQPWTPTDSIAIIKLMAQRLDDQWGLVELRALLQHKVGAIAASALMNAQVPELEHFVQLRSGVNESTRRAATLDRASIALAENLKTNPFPPDPDSGSNNWAVSGSKVTTGKPVLSNDTHLEHSVPSTYWLVQLKSPGIDVEGFIIPGIPFVALGHNERIAFGVTSGDIAVQDLYVERFRSASSDEYLANGHWLKAAHRRELIAIKGQKNQILDVQVTRHGPIVKRRGDSGFALSWTVLQGGDEMELLRRLDRASNWSQFENGLSFVVGPVFNWAYADVDGNIGYHLAGRIPNRLHGDGSLPVEGQDDRYAWHGYLPFDQLPDVFNPSSGFLATANNQLARSTTAIGSSPFFDSPYRVDRIYKRLEANTRMDPQQIGAIQLDDTDTARAELATWVVRVLRGSADPRMQRISAQLESWDKMASADSPVPTFLIALEQTLTDELLEPKLGSALTARYVKSYAPVVVFERVLQGDRSLASLGITRESLLVALPGACNRTANALHASSNAGLVTVTVWGKNNQAIFDHPLGVKWPLDVLFNIRPFPQFGDGLTVYAAKPDHGPASRLVSDLSDWDKSSMVLTLGESGEFNSAHYQDEVQDFRNARWIATPFSDAAVKSATQDTLILKPK